MLTAAERKEKIDQIRQLPARIESLVKDLSDEQLSATSGDEEWTIRQVVHHLADGQMNAYLRTKWVLTEKNPILKPFEQEEWAKLPDTTGEPIEPSLAILRGVHRRWSDLLESLPETVWDRTGIHLEAGKLTLDDLLSTYAGHGETHYQQIRQLRAARGW